MASYGFSTFETFRDEPTLDVRSSEFIEIDCFNTYTTSNTNPTDRLLPTKDAPHNPFPPNPFPSNPLTHYPLHATRFPLHESIRQKLDTFYESQKIPHIIFHGASGTGKITLVQDFIHKIYGGNKHRIKANVMTVNCSHGKGIKFIRDELKFFAKTNIQTNSGVLFKTIVLINAHHLTIDAQSALRRCIELFSYNTRFFIILENKHKLLKPILSRFCEIYVPEYTDTPDHIPGPAEERSSTEFVNLHEHALQNTYGNSLQKQQFREYIHSRLGDILGQPAITYDGKHSTVIVRSPTAFSQLFTEMVDDFYYRGISTLDIISWVNEPENKTAFSRIELSNIMMCFYRIKPEFRCEKMLMFYMLHFMFCSNFELP